MENEICRLLNPVPRKRFCFVVTLALLAAGSAQAQDRQRSVAITVDDLPYATGNIKPGMPTPAARDAVAVNTSILAILKRHRVPTTGFVIQKQVEGFGDVGQDILRRWINAGFDLGNHLYSHADANRLEVPAIESEIEKGEAGFAPLMNGAGKSDRFIRFPFNHTGNTKEKHEAIQEYLKDRGYRLAVCTIDNEDYVFNDAYILALAQKDDVSAARIRDAYLEYTGTQIDYYAKLNAQVFGREPPQVMLLHDNRLNADVGDKVLNLFEKKGYRFVPLSQALSNSAYQTPETYFTPFGFMWGYRWARTLGVHVDGSQEKEPPEWVVHFGSQQAVPAAKP